MEISEIYNRTTYDFYKKVIINDDFKRFYLHKRGIDSIYNIINLEFVVMFDSFNVYIDNFLSQKFTINKFKELHKEFNIYKRKDKLNTILL